MTEITVASDLPAAVRRFVLQWGDMGGQWGVNRSVSQIHALLYLAEKPLTAEEIAETLAMARSNVSNSLRELQGWDLIKRVPVMGDRRDHFAADTDVWSIAAKIVAGRKARELDPAIAALETCVAEAKGDARMNAVATERLTAMLDFTRTAAGWYGQMTQVPRPTLMALIKAGARIAKWIPGKRVV
ncbi:MAG TPA: MarR family transcriptional regulator [Rhizomicrobium sp.]|jgi:DNA-binding transcriptional regulator GbsR (MarR family)|nr:MarR family transcriptional regulator [Rhizomicrobium sp.]